MSQNNKKTMADNAPYQTLSRAFNIPATEIARALPAARLHTHIAALAERRAQERTTRNSGLIATAALAAGGGMLAADSALVVVPYVLAMAGALGGVSALASCFNDRANHQEAREALRSDMRSAQSLRHRTAGLKEIAR